MRINPFEEPEDALSLVQVSAIVGVCLISAIALVCMVFVIVLKPTFF